MKLIETLPFPLWEGALRLLIAFLLGSLIGYERERRRQPAGFRTHSVLALGSSLMSLLSIYITHEYGQGADPSRIASQVITGIGFLGAGAIIRIGVSIKGLTTAASLWTTAGIGLSVGAGMYFLSVFSTVILLFTLSLMSRIEREFMGMPSGQTITLTLEGVEEPMDYLKNVFGSVRIRSIEREEGFIRVNLETAISRKELDESIEKLTKDRRVKKIEIS